MMETVRLTPALHRFLVAVVLVWVLWPAGGKSGTGGSDVPQVAITLTPPAILNLLQTVAPYRVEIGTGLLKETLSFSDPRNVILEEGRVRLTVRVQGGPFPLDQVLKPVLAVRKTAGGSYQVVVESLPIAIPGFGKIDLSEVFPPVGLGTLLEQTVELQGKPLRASLRVEQVSVVPQKVVVNARLILDKAQAR